MGSGLIMNTDIHWYGFHTDHDFAYLLKMFSAQPIANTEAQFVQDLSLIFPNFYDLKAIADMSFGIFRSGLASLSEKLGVSRDDDCQHQAGSDSKITARCFFELLEKGDGSVEACKGDIFGLNESTKTVLIQSSSVYEKSTQGSSRRQSFDGDNSSDCSSDMASYSQLSARSDNSSPHTNYNFNYMQQSND